MTNDVDMSPSVASQAMHSSHALCTVLPCSGDDEDEFECTLHAPTPTDYCVKHAASTAVSSTWLVGVQQPRDCIVQANQEAVKGM